MTKVFVLIEKDFFVSNGIDYASAIGESRINVFANLDDANLAREKKIAKIIEDQNSFYYVYERSIHRCRNYVVLKSKSNNYRVVLEIWEKEIL